jgi:hypothetical protein
MKVATPVKAERSVPLLGWALGTAYVRLWEDIHRAEEALLVLLPREALIADMQDDELRLQDSTLDSRDSILAKLRGAIAVLSWTPPSIYLTGAQSHSYSTHAYTSEDEFLAREQCKSVRHALNVFRDDRRLALVRARNNLLVSVFFTQSIVLATLCFVVFAGITFDELVSGIAFYLAGAIVGLFNRLNLDATSETGVEDFGLSTARLLNTPLFSGLAALGGVLIVPTLAAISTVSFSQDVFVGGTATPVPFIAFSSLLDPRYRPVGIAFAVIFGLTPSMLLGRLQEKTEQFKSDLKSTTSSSGSK